MLLTIDDSCHPPESEQDEKTDPIKCVFAEDESNIQHEGNYHHQTIEYLELVIEKLPAVSIKLSNQFHHEKCHKSQAHVMKHLQQSVVKVAG